MPDYVDPSKEQFAAFRELGGDGVIHMLNLIRLREHAAYEDGRRASGREAYRAYGRETEPIFRRLGGRQFWIGTPELMVIGPSDRQWDLIFIAEYPSPQAFVDMLRDPEYRIAVKHRQAAVADSRLIRLRPQPPGRSFGEF
ncbi:DUF1330 domain-containing protein [Solimonas terrae]|uniref:DUF1330 domain-containing protein n=1 Tax=Solimonas terrae TaxID=1396819 RepID=A0A6M2BUS9_9GAMM|nr:DUF1330 domain-containing protein [Solimonas terrae]NGY05749.1 DUF1330 domain-containing protein [Solimonas terrae]